MKTLSPDKMSILSGRGEGQAMAIALFEHNTSAYKAVLSMLDETGKVCVVHPTGTGKSFIAFK